MSTETIGRYQIREEIGRGQITVVYRAFDTQANREVVVKVFSLEPTGNVERDLSLKAHFRRELKMIASLEHPAIVPVYDVGEHNGQPYFVMRYMAGGSLSQLIANKGKLSLVETTKIILRVASGLDHAHKQNIIHRDIKPDNILFDLDRRVYISDFGVAQPAVTDDASVTEGPVGTEGYISPEQANHETVDERSDVYSLGIVIYQMLTGRNPFGKEANKNPDRPIPDILKEAPDLPPEMSEFMNISLATDKRDRYVTILHLAQALNKAAFGEDSPSTFSERHSRWATIRSGLFWILGSILLVVGFFWYLGRGGSVPFLSIAPTPTVSLPAPTMTVAPTDTSTAIPATATATVAVATFTPEPAPINVSPGGADQVALLSGNDIYLMNPDGSGLVQVRSENAPKSNLQWIPGNRLVYISRNCVFLLDANTKQAQQLLCFNSNELLEGFSVSPDGKLAAISIQRTLNIFPFDIEFLKNVKSRFELLDSKQNCYYNQYPFREVLWSDNNDPLYLAARVIDTRLVNSDQIFLLSADLENCANVALSRLDTIPGGRIDFDKESTKRVGSFDWDGKTSFLLNDSIRNDGFGNLYLYDSSTRDVIQLNPINGECCYRDPRWSPDGTHILFVFQRYDSSLIQLYYVPLAEIQTGQSFTPIELPNGFFATAREKPQPALRPMP